MIENLPITDISEKKLEKLLSNIKKLFTFDMEDSLLNLQTKKALKRHFRT